MNYSVFAVILTLGVIFVNGWTDAPNAIAGCVCSGALSMKKAVLLAAVCNLLGTAGSALLFPAVAKNIFETAGITGADALSASLISVILLAVGAWVFGIPTSESHAIVASIMGAAAASGSAFNFKLLSLTVTGLILSVIGGFIAGFVIYKRIQKIVFKPKTARILQILSAGGMAFMHGAQDGQKFISIFLLASAGGGFYIPLWVAALCSFVMALGTATGGGRIIEKVGKQMVSLNTHKSIASDIAGGLSLFISTVLGMPVSTTHAKTSAVMGCGYADGGINKKTARQMIAAWLITFPVCFILGFIFTKLF